MQFKNQFAQIERISQTVGVPAALMLAAFFGKPRQRVYIPVTASPAHIIGKLIGPAEYEKLVKEFGGQSVSIPELDMRALRRAGQIYRLSALGVPIGDISQAVQIAPETVREIQKELHRMGYFNLAEVPTESEGGSCD